MNASETAKEFFLDPNTIFYLLKKGNRFEEILLKIEALGKVATDVKGLMEVVYYYHSLGETSKGYECANQLRQKLKVYPVTKEDLDLQDVLLDNYPNVVPRELLHAAIMIRAGVNQVICSPNSNYSEMEELSVVHKLGQLGNI